MEKHNVSRLIGAPPGYIGYDDSGELTEKVRRRPFSLVLLDEIEKAHPEVFNLLLQILEDGRLTDNYGRVVDFRNTILIMTSNLGTRQFTLHTNLGFAKGGDEAHSYEKMKETVTNELKRAFNPEMLNRIDEVIIFHPLTKDHMRQIVDLMLHRLEQQLKEKRMSLQVEGEVKEFLIEQGFDPNYGARPLRRAIQRYVEDALAEEVLKGRFGEGGTIRIRKGEGATLYFEVAEPVEAPS